MFPRAPFFFLESLFWVERTTHAAGATFLHHNRARKACTHVSIFLLLQVHLLLSPSLFSSTQHPDLSASLYKKRFSSEDCKGIIATMQFVTFSVAILTMVSQVRADGHLCLGVNNTFTAKIDLHASAYGKSSSYWKVDPVPIRTSCDKPLRALLTSRMSHQNLS